MDPDLWQSGRLQGLAPMVGFGGFAYRITPLVRENEAVGCDVESVDARPQARPQAFADRYEPIRGMGLGRGEPQDAVQVARVKPVRDDGLVGQAIGLDLLLHVDVWNAVPAFQLVRHERVPFAFPHAGGERELEQEHARRLLAAPDATAFAHPSKGTLKAH